MEHELHTSDGPVERLPPQSIEAEQAILGSVLVNPEVLTRVCDLLQPDQFYRKAHQVIFAAVLDLFEKGEPIDIVTVSQYLKDQGKLDSVGGRQYLTDLSLSIATTANAEYYGRTVNEKATLRNLIKAGTEIVASCYEDNDAEIVVDKAEQLIFNIAQRRNMGALVCIKDIVNESFARIEQRYEQRDALSGLSTGFYDLDEMTSGWQKSDLVIIAARPSMGKCLAYDSEILLSDGRIATIEEIFKNASAKLLTLQENRKLSWTSPSVFVDDGIKPVYEVVTRLGRRIQTTLSHPYLTADGWKPLYELTAGTYIAVPRILPVEPTGDADDHQLKILAYMIGDACLDIPEFVFSLKPSKLATFLSWLFSAEGWIVTAAGNGEIGYGTTNARLNRRLQHLLLRFGIIAKLRSRKVSHDGRVHRCSVLQIRERHSLENFAANIRMFGREEQIAKLIVGSREERKITECAIVSADVLQRLRAAKDEQLIAVGQTGDTVTNSTLTASRSLSTMSPRRFAASFAEAPPADRVQGDIYWDQIVSIRYMGEKQVYDLTVPETHNFVANDICVHNTALVLNLAQHAAVECKAPVAVFSLEMSKEQLVQRLLCAEARIDANKMRTGFLQSSDWQNLAAAMGRLGEAPLYIDDSAVVTALDVRAKARRLKAEMKGLGLIIIDYIQLMQGRAKSDGNRVQEVSEISRSLKQLARELDCPVLALSQLSRAVEARQNKRPMLSDLRESGSIEQDADIVMFIYRDDYYNQESEKRGEAEIIIAKQRNGPVGTVELLYQASITRFLNKASTNQFAQV